MDPNEPAQWLKWRGHALPTQRSGSLIVRRDGRAFPLPGSPGAEQDARPSAAGSHRAESRSDGRQGGHQGHPLDGGAHPQPARPRRDRRGDHCGVQGRLPRGRPGLRAVRGDRPERSRLGDGGPRTEPIRFLIDECISPRVTSWLREQGHEVSSVFEEAGGATDEEVICRAGRENRVLVTSDKDFGEKAFREGLPHEGIVLLRLKDRRALRQMKLIQELLRQGEQLAGRFLVVGDDGKVRAAGEDRDGSGPVRG